MALRVKAGVTLSSGDVVALDKNGEVIKASKGFDPIGIVVQGRNLGLIVKSVSSDGYMGATVDSIVSVASKWNPGTDPDPIADAKRAMMSDPHLSAVIQSRINAASKSQTAADIHEELNNQVREHASRVIIRALNDALDGQTVGVNKTAPTGLAPTNRLHLPMEDLSVKCTDKESLKEKMEEARLRLKGLIKP